MNLLIEIQYLPPIDYLKGIASAEYVEIELWENFQKTSYRNRCSIFGSNGTIELSIPIKGGREQKTSMKEIEIDNSSDWRVRHIRSIKSSYAKSPFFEYYISDIERLINLDKKFLIKLNMEILTWLVKTLKLKCEIHFSSTYRKEPIGLLDLRNHFRPQKQNELTADWSPKYIQVFQNKHGFQPNLSILDLLFNEGPNAGNLLRVTF